MSWRVLLPFVKPYRLQLLGTLVAVMVSSLCVLAVGLGIRHLVDAGIQQGTHAKLLVGIVVVLAITTGLRVYGVQTLGEKICADLRCQLVEHILSLGPGGVEQWPVGDLLTRVGTDTSTVQLVVGNAWSAVLRASAIVVGSFAMMILTSPLLSAVVLLCLPIVLIPMLVLNRATRTLARLSQDRLSDSQHVFEEMLSNLATVQAFVQESRQALWYRQHAQRVVNATQRRALLRAWALGGNYILACLAILTVLGIGTHLLAHHALTPGGLSAFAFYAISSALGASTVFEALSDIQRAGASLDRIVALLRATPNIRPPAHPLPLSLLAPPPLHLNQVRVAYPSRPGTWALDGITLAFPPGSTTALVGPSGAGKSTILKLLMRAIDPTEGNVTVNGVDVTCLDPSVLRRHIAVVAQEPQLFSGRVAENLCFGKPHASTAQLEQAAKDAYALDFIQALPGGMDAMIGPKGAQLSGGQRQRLAIARALLLDAPILLLDEATSALDTQSERLVQAALQRVLHGRTTVVVAHRLSTIEHADRVVVLHQGRIEAVGTHQTLLASNALYQRLAAGHFGIDPAL